MMIIPTTTDAILAALDADPNGMISDSGDLFGRQADTQLQVLGILNALQSRGVSIFLKTPVCVHAIMLSVSFNQSISHSVSSFEKRICMCSSRLSESARLLVRGRRVAAAALLS